VVVHQRNAAEPIKGLTCCKFTFVERGIGVNSGGPQKRLKDLTSRKADGRFTTAWAWLGDRHTG
jgi:hypothetical protein